MRKLAAAAAVAVLAASFSSSVLVPWSPAPSDAPLGSILPHHLTLVAPAMAAGAAADAF